MSHKISWCRLIYVFNTLKNNSIELKFNEYEDKYRISQSWVLIISSKRELTYMLALFRTITFRKAKKTLQWDNNSSSIYRNMIFALNYFSWIAIYDR